MKSKNTTIYATLWALIDRFSSQIVAFVIGIVLARLLTPSDYGIVGLTTIFIAISNVFIDSGFANGLIRKIDRTEQDLSTAFIFNVVVGVAIYCLLFFCAPFISKFFNEPILIPVLRIIGINIILLSFSIVPVAILTSNLNIRKQAIINLFSLIPAGGIAIYAAYKGAGVYALVLQTVVSSLIKMVLLWSTSMWKPKLCFSKTSFNYLWSFGSKLLIANIIGTVFNEIYSILIGKYIGKTDLGYYSKSSHLSQNVNGITTGIVQKISLPVLSKYQSSKAELCVKFSKLMRILVLFIAPLSAILCFLAKDIIIFLWTDKWIESVRIFQYLIIGIMFGPISQLSLSLLQVTNRTDLILKLEFPKKAIYVILIALGFNYGVLGLAFVQIFINITASLFNMYPTKKIFKYSYTKQLWDVFKYMIYAYLIAYVIWRIIPSYNPGLSICLYTFVYVFSYFAGLILVKDEFVYTFLCKMLIKK